MIALAAKSSLEHDKSSELACINVLPFELLEEIFKECGQAIALGDHTSFPFNLAQVCRRWYSVIYASSRCWSCFRIDNNERPDAVYQQLLLCLSKASMLSFSINTSYLSPSTTEIMKLLMHGIHRWKNVSIPTHFLPCPTDGSMEGLGLPHLKMLRINGGRFPLGISAPNLTHLCLHAISSDFSQLISSTLLDQLTHFQLNHCSLNAESLIHLVNRLENVEDLQLSWVNVLGSPINNHKGRIRMKHLRSLTLAMSYDNNSFVLEFLRAPNLLSFRLYANNCDAYDDGKAAQGFIRGSNCDLRDLTLWKYPISSFLSITHHLRSIQSLHLGCTSMQVYGIRRFVTALPRIKSFSLCYDGGYNSELFDGLIPSLRSKLIISLVELKFGGIIDCDRAVELSSGRSQGLKIEDRLTEKDKFFMDHILYDDLKVNSWWI